MSIEIGKSLSTSGDSRSAANRVAAPVVMPCPTNGASSRRVPALTVRSLLRKLPFAMPDTQYYFCDSPDCDLVYFAFDPRAPRFRREDLSVRVGVKNSSDPIPVCYCFGFTRQDILEEIRATGQSTVAKRIAVEVEAGRCACEIKNPSGKCCLGEVARAVKSTEQQENCL